MNKILKIVKKIVLSGFTLFAFNLMISPLNFLIPINSFTVVFTAIFGILSLPFFSILIMFYLW